MYIDQDRRTKGTTPPARTCEPVSIVGAGSERPEVRTVLASSPGVAGNTVGHTEECVFAVHQVYVSVNLTGDTSRSTHCNAPLNTSSEGNEREGREDLQRDRK